MPWHRVSSSRRLRVRGGRRSIRGTAGTTPDAASNEDLVASGTWTRPATVRSSRPPTLRSAPSYDRAPTGGGHRRQPPRPTDVSGTPGFPPAAVRALHETAPRRRLTPVVLTGAPDHRWDLQVPGLGAASPATPLLSGMLAVVLIPV